MDPQQQKLEDIINNYKPNLRGRDITPEESKARLKELILYIAKQCEDDPNFDMEKLKFLLYKIDTSSYIATGESITGSIYIKEENPVLDETKNTEEKNNAQENNSDKQENNGVSDGGSNI